MRSQNSQHVPQEVDSEMDIFMKKACQEDVSTFAPGEEGKIAGLGRVRSCYDDETTKATGFPPREFPHWGGPEELQR